MDDTYRRLYEHVPLKKLRLVFTRSGRNPALCDDRLVLTYVTQADYEASGRGGDDRGDHRPPSLGRGAKVAALVRDQGARGRAARKVSLRSSEGDVDVSAIARSQGGGGHKRAAGFSTDLELEELIQFLCGEVGAQLGS